MDAVTDRIAAAPLPDRLLADAVTLGHHPRRVDTLKEWQRRRPELFRKRVYDHAGCDKVPDS